MFYATFSQTLRCLRAMQSFLDLLKPCVLQEGSFLPLAKRRIWEGLQTCGASECQAEVYEFDILSSRIYGYGSKP